MNEFVLILLKTQSQICFKKEFLMFTFGINCNLGYCRFKMEKIRIGIHVEFFFFFTKLSPKK